MQARYYAKLYNQDPLKDFAAKIDTDRGIIHYCKDKCTDDSYYNSYNYRSFWIVLPLNILIAIFGIYCLNLIIIKYESYEHNSLRRKVFKSIYWASVIIAAAVNIACLVIDTRWLVQYPSTPYVFYYFGLPLGILILLVETVAVFIVVKKFRISSCVCGCCSVMRLVHTLAICHLLWFLHRVGSGLIVAAFFIALAPGQTIAALSLMYLVILVSIVYVACCLYFIQTCRNKCKMVCKLFILTITYLCLVGLAICFTLIYIALSENGLTSSTIGHVLLSLIPPMAVFFIGITIKRELKGSGSRDMDSSDSTASKSSEFDKREVNSGSINECTPLVQ